MADEHEHKWKDCECKGCQRTPGIVAYCLVCNAERHGEGSANFDSAKQFAESIGKEIGEAIIVTVNMPTLEERLARGD